MKNQQKFPEDFEREALKDSVYLQAARLEEEATIMKEIMEDENRLPATIEIIGTLPKLKKDEVERDTLPF